MFVEGKFELRRKSEPRTESGEDKNTHITGFMQDAASHILRTKRESKWLEAREQWRRAESEDPEPKQSTGPHSGTEAEMERRQGSFLFLGKPWHSVTMATAARSSPSSWSESFRMDELCYVRDGSSSAFKVGLQ